jgi:hypothetical protein
MLHPGLSCRTKPFDYRKKEKFTINIRKVAKFFILGYKQCVNKKYVFHIITVRQILIWILFLLGKSNGLYFRVGSKESRVELTKAQRGIRRGFYGIWGSACSFNAGPRPFRWGNALYSPWNVKPAEASRGSFCRTATTDPFDFRKAGYETGAKKI